MTVEHIICHNPLTYEEYDGLLFTNLQADHEAIEMARMVVDPSDYHAFLALAQLIKQNIIVDRRTE